MGPHNKSPCYHPINNILPSEQAQLLPELPDHLIDTVQEELQHVQIGVDPIIEGDLEGELPSDLPQLESMEMDQNPVPLARTNTTISQSNNIERNEMSYDSQIYLAEDSTGQERRVQERRLKNKRRTREIADQNKSISLTKMVRTAILELDRQGNTKGVSYFKIKKFIKENYKDENCVKRLRRFILNAVAKGKLIRLTGKGVSGSFRIPGHTIKSKPIRKPRGRARYHQKMPESKQKTNLRLSARNATLDKYINAKRKQLSYPRVRPPAKKSKSKAAIRRRTKDQKGKRLYCSIAKRAVSRLLVNVASCILTHQASRTVQRALSRALLKS